METLKKGFIAVAIAVLAISTAAAAELSPLESLGRDLFFDRNLSVNNTQSCASCHAPATGFTGPDSRINETGAVMPGAIGARFGNRKPPTAAYGGESPAIHYSEGAWTGGMFWDGRATGAAYGDPLADQAAGPFVNPWEMAMPDMKQACIRVDHSYYARLFEEVWGPASLDFVKDPAGTYERIAKAIAAYERSAEVNPFSSRFDLFWDNAANAGKDVTGITFSAQGAGSGAAATATVQSGSITAVTITSGGSGYLAAPAISFGGGGMGGGMGGGGGGMGSGATAYATVENGAVVSITITAGGSGYTSGQGSSRVNITASSPNCWENFRNLGLNDAELQGLAVFNDPGRGDCARCHSLMPGQSGYPVFTDFRYWNIGVPKNPANPFYTMPAKWNRDGYDWVDYGLGGYLKSAGYAPDIYEPEMGKFKTPTLRNVDLRPSEIFVKAYGHNGFFKTLEEIVLFYTWRAHMEAAGNGSMGGGGMGGGGGMMPDPTLFPAPEVSRNLETLNFTMGMQAMTDQEHILAFLKTLSDGYRP